MGYPHHDNAGELLTLTSISLDYGQFKALKNIHLTLGYSEVHAIALRTCITKYLREIIKNDKTYNPKMSQSLADEVKEHLSVYFYEL